MVSLILTCLTLALPQLNHTPVDVPDVILDIEFCLGIDYYYFFLISDLILEVTWRKPLLKRQFAKQTGFYASFEEAFLVLT